MKKVIQLQDLQPGTKYLVRARVVNQYGVVSEWSQTYELNVTSDNTKPSRPSQPTIQIAGPQKIVVSHNNTKQGGGNLEFDVVSYKVYTNTTSSNIGGTLIHTMSATRPGSGLDSFATINVNAPLVGTSAQTLYFYVTAVDSAGNESDPSNATTGTPITYFDSAYISELTADRIRTGTLQADQSISVGTVAPIIIKSNADSPRGQIYIGTTVNPTGAEGSGYKDSQTAFYVDSTGKFSLKDKLYWDGNTLTIDGYFQIGDEETTISGNQIRTGHLISTNYISNVVGQPQAKSTEYTSSGTWIDLDDGEIYSENFYLTSSGDAVFRGNIFGSRGIFNGELPASEIPDLEYEVGQDPRVPTVLIESDNTNDGFLVFFKDTGTDSGAEFYVKQGDGTNWRRGSLSHLDDVEGGFIRLGAFPSSTGLTPGRIRIFAESSGNQQGEIYLDARRTYAQKIFLTEPSTTGDWANDPVTNFWKDPDGVDNGQDYFKVGSSSGSAIVVKKKLDGTDKVVIKDYEIEGSNQVQDGSKITINTVDIGKDVGGTGKHGIKIDNYNYWYDPATLSSSDVVFRAGWTGDKKLEVRKDGSVLFEGDTNPTGGEIKGLLVIKNVTSDTTFSIGKNVISERDGIKLNDNNYWTISQTGLTANFKVGGSSKYLEWTGSELNISTDTVLIGGINAATTTYADSAASSAAAAISIVQKWNNGEVTGITLDSLGAIRSAGKTYNSATQGWILEYNGGTPRFEIGSTSSTYMRWTGSALEIKGEVIGGSVIDPGVDIPGGSFGSSPIYGDGMGFNGNRLFLTDGYAGGIIAFSDGSSTAYGSIGPSNGTKFSGLEGGNGIIIGTPGYPSIEIGKDSSNDNKILLYTAANVGLELRPANFILRGGSVSRIRGIPSTSSVPSGKKVLYGDEDQNLEWGPASGGSAGSVPTGTITMYGGATAPSGWLFCDGSSYSTSTYSNLFTVIGYSYGGSSTVFNVPNFNNRFPRQGSNRDTGRGVTGGQDSFTLTQSNIPSHSHGPGDLATNLAGSHSHGPGDLSTNLAGSHSHGPGDLSTNLAGSHSHGPGTLSTNSAGAHIDTNTTYTFGTASNTTTTGSANRLTNSTSANSNQSVSSHSHTVNAGTTDTVTSHSHIVNAGTTSTQTSHSHIVNSGTTGTESSHSHIVNSGSTGTWGSSTPTSIDNRPEFLQVNFIIKT